VWDSWSDVLFGWGLWLRRVHVYANKSMAGPFSLRQ
jgi:hypothetical protein